MTDSAVAPLPPALGAARPRVRVVLPSWRDPRLHVAGVLLTVQLLGQVALDWELSVLQLLTALGTCAVLEIAITLWRQRVLAWPASALLTGNGVALILRVNGTEHGDWWAADGLGIFAATAGAGLLSKYVVRVDGRPLFNPSNIALVACFLLLGSDRVAPLDFWWGPFEDGVVIATAVVIAGGLAITWRIGLLRTAATFYATFAAALAVVAIAGHCMTARWSLDPVCGARFWEKLVTSPEIMIFAFFMITDPRTAPIGSRPRLVYGALVGVLAAALVAPQRTEFGAKVAVLGALVLGCALRPILERAFEPAARRTRISAAIAVLAVPPLLVVAGMPARHADTETFPPALVAAGEVFVELPALPAVVRDDSVDTITEHIDAAEVQQIGRDVALHLAQHADGLRVDSMTLRVVRRPTPQSPPRVVVHVTGASGVAPLDTLFVVRDDGGGYVVVDEIEP